MPALLSQIKWPRELEIEPFNLVQFCFDPIQSHLLVSWQSHVTNKSHAIYSYSNLTNPELEISPIPGYRAQEPLLSATGKWFSYNDGTSLRLMDWRQKKPIESAELRDFVPVVFSPDESILVCKSHKTISLLSLEQAKVLNELKIEANFMVFYAIHPKESFLVGTIEDRLAIIDLQSFQLENELFVGKKMDCSALIGDIKRKMIAAGKDPQKVEAVNVPTIRSSIDLRSIQFSPDGQFLFCGTNAGLLVFRWDELLKSFETTPNPITKSTPQVDPNSRENSFVDGMAFDEKTNRLLFCDYTGTIQFLDMERDDYGILLNPSKKIPMARLELSADRKILCAFCAPFNLSTPQFFQIWDYPALCKAAGLP